MYNLTMNMNIAGMETGGIRELSLDELDFVSGGVDLAWDTIFRAGFIGGVGAFGFFVGSPFGPVGSIAGAAIGGAYGEMLWQMVTTEVE